MSPEPSRHALEALHEIAWARTVSETWGILVDAMAGYGFDRLFYAATRFRSGNLLGDIGDALILSNWPEPQYQAYVAGGLFKDAPLLNWAAANVGVRSWRTVTDAAAAGRLPEGQRRVAAFHASHGMRAGYVVAFPRASERDGYGLGLSAVDTAQDVLDAVWDRSGTAIGVLANVAHLKFMSLPHGDHVRILTPRQREVLELVADGKTVQDVAIVIGRRPATVEKHLRLAREALGVETTAQAVLKMGLHNRFFTERYGVVREP